MARNELLVNFRFLDRALLSLEPVQTPDASFMTDGVKLYYDPWFINRRYREEASAVVRGYLHLILHLVFRHSLAGEGVDRRRWSLACDIAAENIINDMDRGLFASRRSAPQRAFIEKQRAAVGADKPLTAEILYAALEEQEYSDAEWDELSLLFWGDSHALWYSSPAAVLSPDIDVHLRWEEISRRMQVELELLEKDKAGLLASQLRRINKARQDYDELLRKFAVPREILRISDEEFDNNYYSYGLQLYGDMPIVEPLEYSAGRRIKDFVIALDTSGSIQTDLAEKFVSHTYKILSSQDSFDADCRLHILQCDDRVRDDFVVRTAEDMELYINDLKILGRGETDFRPVFDYVDTLRRRGELGELKGLIYFTDGEGIFPEHARDYAVAFVIHQPGMYEPVRVPSWAMKVELADEDIRHGKFHS